MAAPIPPLEIVRCSVGVFDDLAGKLSGSLGKAAGSLGAGLSQGIEGAASDLGSALSRSLSNADPTPLPTSEVPPHVIADAKAQKSRDSLLKWGLIGGGVLAAVGMFGLLVSRR